MNLETYSHLCAIHFANELSLRQGRILVAIHEKPGISLQEIANVVRISTAAMTGQCDRLFEGGYITRMEGVADRRKTATSLTPVGLAFVESVLKLEGAE